MTVQALLATKAGRVVRQLSKRTGEVGRLSSIVYNDWKRLVWKYEKSDDEIREVAAHEVAEEEVVEEEVAEEEVVKGQTVLKLEPWCKLTSKVCEKLEHITENGVALYCLCKDIRLETIVKTLVMKLRDSSEALKRVSKDSINTFSATEKEKIKKLVQDLVKITENIEAIAASSQVFATEKHDFLAVFLSVARLLDLEDLFPRIEALEVRSRLCLDA